jgi:hypothetical protein
VLKSVELIYPLFPEVVVHKDEDIPYGAYEEVGLFNILYEADALDADKAFTAYDADVIFCTNDAVAAFRLYDAVAAYDAVTNDPVIEVTIKDPVTITFNFELNPSLIINSLAIYYA